MVEEKALGERKGILQKQAEREKSRAIKEAEQVQWERRLEEFCEAREEAVEVLKSGGGDFRVRNSTSDQCQYKY